MDNRELMVTIRCLAYNHESYIRQCLEGFVMQKTNFRFEAIVHDDASTDGTAAIIREYAEKYPDIIKPIFETENQYSKRDGSIRRIMNEHTHGKYVAMCEGDDYWIDPLKLQKQVDFLESNPDYGLSYSKARCFNEKQKKFLNTIGNKVDGLNDLVLKNQITTLTVMYRKEASYGYDDFIKGQKWLMGDKPLWCYIAINYKLHFDENIFGVYRILQNSAMQRSSFEQRLRFLESSFSVSFFFSDKCKLGLEKKIELIKLKYFIKVAIIYKKYLIALKYFLQYFKTKIV